MSEFDSENKVLSPDEIPPLEYDFDFEEVFMGEVVEILGSEDGRVFFD